MTATRARSTFFVSLLALLTIALAIVASSAVVASASTRVGPETHVRANAHPISTRVGAHDRVIADQVGRPRPARYEFVSATGVATKEESLNLASEARTTHILEGDASEEAYARQASEFFQSGLADELPTKIDPKTGTIRIYDPESNTFGSYNANGTTRTFYKPDPSMHPYQTNWDYWRAEPGYSPWRP